MKKQPELTAQTKQTLINTYFSLRQNSEKLSVGAICERAGYNRCTFYRYFNLATVPFYWNTLEPEYGKPRYAKDSVKIYRRPAPDLCME